MFVYICVNMYLYLHKIITSYISKHNIYNMKARLCGYWYEIEMTTLLMTDKTMNAFLK